MRQRGLRLVPFAVGTVVVVGAFVNDVLAHGLTLGLSAPAFTLVLVGGYVVLWRRGHLRRRLVLLPALWVAGSAAFFSFSLESRSLTALSDLVGATVVSALLTALVPWAAASGERRRHRRAAASNTSTTSNADH